MRQITTEGAEQDSEPTLKVNNSGKTAETGMEGQAVPDPKQEPADNNESSRAGINAMTGRDAAEEQGDDVPLAPGKETASPNEKSGSGERGRRIKHSEAGKSPAQGSLASSTSSAQEGSLVLRLEQREGESVSTSLPADRTKTAEKADHGTKRRASVELTSSDGEPLSRMDSEDRFVETVRGLGLILKQPRGAVDSQYHAKFTALNDSLLFKAYLFTGFFKKMVASAG